MIDPLTHCTPKGKVSDEEGKSGLDLREFLLVLGMSSRYVRIRVRGKMKGTVNSRVTDPNHKEEGGAG